MRVHRVDKGIGSWSICETTKMIVDSLKRWLCGAAFCFNDRLKGALQHATSSPLAYVDSDVSFGFVVMVKILDCLIQTTPKQNVFLDFFKVMSFQTCGKMGYLSKKGWSVTLLQKRMLSRNPRCANPVLKRPYQACFRSVIPNQCPVRALTVCRGN